DRPPYMPKAVRGALKRPGERQDYPRSADEIIYDDACDHDQEIAGVEPKEFPPGIFGPPVRLHFLDEAAAGERVVEDVDAIRRDHRPEDPCQGQRGHDVSLS